MMTITSSVQYIYSANLVSLSEAQQKEVKQKQFGGGPAPAAQIVVHRPLGVLVAVSPAVMRSLAMVVFGASMQRDAAFSVVVTDSELALFVRSRSSCLPHINLLATCLSVEIYSSHLSLQAALCNMQQLRSLRVVRPQHSRQQLPADSCDVVFSPPSRSNNSSSCCSSSVDVHASLFLQHLEECDLSECHNWFTNDAAISLSKLPNLRKMTVSNTRVGADGVIAVARGCAKLEHLHCGTLGGAPAMNSEQLDALADACADRLLSFSLNKTLGVSSAAWTSFLVRLTRIQSLDIAHNSAVDDQVVTSGIAAIQSTLRSLHLANTHITSAGLKALAASAVAASLEHLDLSYCTFVQRDPRTKAITVPAIADADLKAALKSFPNLRSFTAADMGDVVSKGTLSALADFTKLEKIDISSGANDEICSGDSVILPVVQANSDCLKMLAIGSFDREVALVTEVVIKAMADMTSLQLETLHAEACSCEMSDAALILFLQKRGRNLKSLRIDGWQKITDAVVTAMIDSCPAIEEFFYGGTQISESAAIRLERKTNFKRGVYM